jgi:hypothetical protein
VSSIKLAGIFLATIIVGVVPCFGGAIATDGTWYNFWNATAADVQATNGSSCLSVGCTEHYSAPGDLPWTFTIPTGMQGLFVITDGGHIGDEFTVFNHTGSTTTLIGMTSLVTPDLNNGCGSFPTACLNDSRMSHGSFVLPSGGYSITINEDQFFEPSFLAWFKVTESAAPAPPGPATVPEPGTFAFIGSALLAVSFLGRRKRA